MKIYSIFVIVALFGMVGGEVTPCAECAKQQKSKHHSNMINATRCEHCITCKPDIFGTFNTEMGASAPGNYSISAKLLQ
jgi:hypothetical protein